MRVDFFTDGPESPGSRFRCLQFFPHLRARGIDCHAHFAYDERYNDVFQERWAFAYKLGARLKRVARLLLDSDADLIFLHKTALAFTGLPELLRSFRRTPIVFDFDDAIYLATGGDQSVLRERAFRRAVSVADHIIAGNQHLADVANAPEKTTLIPSVVDMAVHTPQSRHGSGDSVIGWIGTASNFPNLEPVLPQVLEALQRLPNARFRIVSNGVLLRYENHPRVEHWKWHAARELQALHSFDIGLMPLADNEQTRGKCGFKMIQYMSVGVPVVASAVGANPVIFEGSDAGALVPPGGDWVEPIVALAGSSELRIASGRSARQHVMGRYSVGSVIDTYVTIFKSLLTQAHKR